MRKQQPHSRQPAPLPDSDAARKAARRKRRIRRRIIRTTIVLTVFLILVVLIGLLVLRITGASISILAVKAVTVEGETRYAQEQIIKTGGIYVGQSLLVVNKVQAADNILAQFPYLEHVDVGSSSYGTIRIAVREARVMGVVETAAGYMVLGANNHALELITDETALPAGAVRIRGAALLEETVGKNLLDERGLNVCTTLLTAAEQYGLSGITLIDMTEKTNIRLMWKDQIQVVLGNESNLTMQIKAFTGILPTLLGNNGDTATGRLDMSSYADDNSSNDRAIFSPMTIEELTAPPKEDSESDEVVADPAEPTTDGSTAGEGTDTTEAETTAATSSAA